MSSESVGGLGYDIQTVGASISITGVILIGYNFVLYPIIANKLGAQRTFMVGEMVLYL